MVDLVGIHMSVISLSPFLLGVHIAPNLRDSCPVVRLVTCWPTSLTSGYIRMKWIANVHLSPN